MQATIWSAYKARRPSRLNLARARLGALANPPPGALPPWVNTPFPVAIQAAPDGCASRKACAKEPWARRIGVEPRRRDIEPPPWPEDRGEDPVGS